MGKIQTSKVILVVVIGAGLACLLLGLFRDILQVSAYALIFAGALYNRIDSCFRGYKFSLSAGGA